MRSKPHDAYLYIAAVSRRLLRFQNSQAMDRKQRWGMESF